MIEIGQYKHHPQFGIMKVTGIDYDKSNNPIIIDAETNLGTRRLLLRFANLRDATDEEINAFLDAKQQIIGTSGTGAPKFYSIMEEIPDIQNVFDEIVYVETLKFLNEHPNLQVRLYGADTNIFYSDYILSAHSTDGADIEKVTNLDKWDFYNFANYLDDNEKYKILKVRLQPILFGENQYAEMTYTNSDSIIKDVQEIFITSVLRTKNRITQLDNSKVVIIDHDQSAENAIKLVEEINTKKYGT